MSGADCTHGIVFDEAEARALLAEWSPKASREVRKRWPRLYGVCPLGCGFSGIGYASMAHYQMGDW